MEGDAQTGGKDAVEVYLRQRGGLRMVVTELRYFASDAEQIGFILGLLHMWMQGHMCPELRTCVVQVPEDIFVGPFVLPTVLWRFETMCAKGAHFQGMTVHRVPGTERALAFHDFRTDRGADHHTACDFVDIGGCGSEDE